MPKVQTEVESPVIAVVCSDVHLSHTVPSARSGEASWYDAQRRVLRELTHICAKYHVPCVIAGDLFDRWNSPAELINLAITHLPPNVYAVPGQHDLAHHCYADMEKTAYGTLVASGRIINMSVGKVLMLSDTSGVVGVPWGFKLRNINKKGRTLSAIIHQFVYDGATGHVGATNGYFSESQQALLGFRNAFFGDNHKAFSYINLPDDPTPSIINCGALQRRKSDEIRYEPKVYLLHDNGAVTPRPLLCASEDTIEAKKEVIAGTSVDINEFVDALSGLGSSFISFKEAVTDFIRNKEVRSGVAAVLREVLAKEFKA